jgi:predicted nucleic-acid-binding protein
LAECVYVLLKIYRGNSSTAADKLGGLLHYKGVANTDKKDLIDSLNLFAQTHLWFVDCVLCTKSKNDAMPFVTFDAELTNISTKN